MPQFESQMEDHSPGPIENVLGPLVQSLRHTVVSPHQPQRRFGSVLVRPVAHSVELAFGPSC
jgi:hypothetical protein